jgi:hypothetical protein
MSGDGSRNGPDCRNARLHIGGDPQALPREVAAHLESCAGCRRFRDETTMLDGRLRAALELPLAGFTRRAAAPPRRLALAASIALGLLLAGGAWLLRPSSALAGAVMEHVKHEAGSWERHDTVAAAAVADVLRAAGVEFDSTMPVVYAMACPFRGRRVPHLVVQTRDGPMTVMLLAGEKVAQRQEFSEDGYRGVLLPAGDGAVAVLMRGDAAPGELAGEVVNAIRWR